MKFRCYCEACKVRGECEHDGISLAICPNCGSTWSHYPPEPPDEEVRKALEIPSLPRRAWNFFKAVAKHLAFGLRYRTQSEIEHIAAICEQCELFDGQVCTHEKCGCPVANQGTFLLNKLAMKSEHCPIDKW